MSLLLLHGKTAAGGGGGGLVITSPVATWTGTGSPTTSASFTATSGGLLVLGHCQWNGTMNTPTNSGTAFTWTQRASDTAGVVQHKVWTAPITAGQSMTVSLNSTSEDGILGMVWHVTGQHASPIGVSGAASNVTTNNLTVNFTASVAGSATFVHASDYQELGTMTSSNLLDPNTTNFSGVVDGLSGYRANASAGATSFNLDAGGTGTAGTGYAYVEIKPA